jgi:hypothetical protein
MKALISILIVLLFIFTVWKLWEYWERVEANKEREARQEAAPPNLGNLEYTLQTSLRDVMSKKDPAALKAWLDRNRRQIQDPRLAWIELDYVIMVAPQNPAEAKRVYREVKERTLPDSPVYKRVKELEKTYD